MSWPTMSDYQEAIQAPGVCFNDSELRSGKPKLDLLGLPRPITGGFASVYEITSSGRRWAVRCFLKEFKDQGERYAQIGSHLATSALPYTVHFDYQPTGILVSGKRFPILKMGWIEGVPLNDFVERAKNSRQTLEALVHRWNAMLDRLRAAGIAHGDLQHGNVLVASDGSLRLIDYDGMWVPSLQGRGSHEVGHPSYQSPRRTQKDFDRDIDSFAGQVIRLAIAATSRMPSLWDQFNNGDNMLFRADDFRDPSASRVFGSLLSITDPDIVTQARDLIRACGFSPDQVKPLSGLVSGTVSGASWLEDHRHEDSGAGKKGAPAFVFSFAVSWQRPGQGTFQRVRKEPEYETRTRLREEPVFETRVRYRTEPVFETRTRTVTARIPASSSWLSRTVRSVLGLAATSQVQREETYRVQVGTREIPEHYQIQVGTRNVPDGTYRAISGYRSITETVSEHRPGHNARVSAVSMTRNAAQLISGDEAGVIALWSAETGERLRNLPAIPEPISGVAGLGNGKVAVAGGKLVRVWTVAGNEVHVFANERNSNVYGIAGSPDGRFLAAALGALELHVWQLSSKSVFARLRAHKRKVLCAAFGPTHALLVSGSEDMTVKVWDVRKEECLHTMNGHTQPVRCVSVSQTDAIAASGGDDGTLFLWDLKSGQHLIRIVAHSSAVTGVHFSPDGRSVITSGDDGRLRCWDVRSGKPINELPRQAPGITAIAIDETAQRMVIASEGSLIVWRNQFATSP